MPASRRLRRRFVTLATLTTLIVVAAHAQASPLQSGPLAAAAGRRASVAPASAAAISLAAPWLPSPAVVFVADSIGRLTGWLGGHWRHRPTCEAGSQMDPNGHCI